MADSRAEGLPAKAYGLRLTRATVRFRSTQMTD